jgi:F-type H+-transporting ATPase subunit b
MPTLLAPLFLSAASEQPLIDLDGTFFIQLTIFLVLFLLLRSLVFQPFMQMLTERDKRTRGAREDAKSLVEQATAKVAAYEQSIQQARLAAQEDRAQLRSSGAAEARSLVETARQESQKTLDLARKDLKREADKAEQDLARRASELGQRVAEKVLQKA